MKTNRRGNFNNKGITLIALIITIIVLLILTGVAISTLTGQNGLLERARIAKEKTDIAQTNENQRLQEYENLMGIPRNSEVNNQTSQYINSIDFEIKNGADNEIEIIVSVDTRDTNKILGYHYFAIEEANEDNINATLSASNNVTLSGLSIATKYKVFVVAYDIYNNYKVSTIKSMTTPEAPVISITSTSGGLKYKSQAYTNEDISEIVEEALFNQNTNEGGNYYGLMLSTAVNSEIKLTVTKKIKIYAYGHKYSDSGGASGKNAIFKKYNETTLEYEDYASCSTKADGTKYELVILEPGKYTLTPAGRYVNFDEWEYELVE